MLQAQLALATQDKKNMTPLLEEHAVGGRKGKTDAEIDNYK